MIMGQTQNKRNCLKKLVIGMGILALALLSIYYFYIKETGSPFVDLPQDHEAFETIMWAVEKEIITGYADGTIQPNKPVSEAELLAMLFRTFPQQRINNKESEEGDWAVRYYKKADKLNWVVWGRGSRNQLINRVDLARIVANSLGYNLSADGSIQTLLQLGYVEAKQGHSVEGFGAGEVTRAEALEVMKRLEEAGITELKEAPVEPSSEPVIESKFIERIKPALELGKAKGYDTRMVVWARELGFSQNGQGIAFLNYHSVKSADNLLVLYQANEQKHRQFVLELFISLGITIDEGIEDDMLQVLQERKSLIKEYGQWEFMLSPGPVPDYVQILFRKR